MQDTPMEQIRLFEEHDRQKVVDFFAGLGPETRAFFNRFGSNTRFALKFFDNDPEDRAQVVRYLAEADGEMVGYSFAWDMHTGIPWFGIVLSDNYKGHGLGVRMTKTIIDHCGALGKGGILLTTHTANIRAQVMYEKCGFKVLPYMEMKK